MRKSRAKNPLDLTRLSLGKWEAIYKPRKNPYGGNGAYDGRMFETYGPEEIFVYNCDPKAVWTVLDVEGKLYLAAGRHYVNRFGYFICEVEWKNYDLTVRYA